MVRHGPLATGTLYTRALAFPDMALRAAAAGALDQFGAASNYWHLGDSSYESLLSDHFTAVTPEIGCKWSDVQAAPGVFTFSECDRVLEAAEAAGQQFRGHTVMWASGDSGSAAHAWPAWLNDTLSAAELRDTLKTHVQTVVGRYAGRQAVYAWDVVNEALDESGSIGDSLWAKLGTGEGGERDFIDEAFHAARLASPETTLAYNDYNIASMTGWSAAKSQGCYDLVAERRARGVPIDAVGMQLHVDTEYNLVSGVQANMRRLGALGVEAHVTEIDVACAPLGQSCADVGGWTAAREEAQAQVYAAVLAACLDEPACTSFTTWGVTDAITWRRDERPLLFDEKLEPKLAVQAIRDTLAANRSWVDAYYARAEPAFKGADGGAALEGGEDSTLLIVLLAAGIPGATLLCVGAALAARRLLRRSEKVRLASRLPSTPSAREGL